MKEAIILIVSVLCIVALLSKVPRKLRHSEGEAYGFEYGVLGKGEQVRDLSALRGKTVLLNFWASWCGPCMDEMPSLSQLEKALGPKGLVVLAYNVEGLAEFSAPEDFPSLLIRAPTAEMNDSILEHYHVDQVPISYVIDRAGKIQKVYTGPRDWMRENILSEIKGFLSS